MQVSRLVVHGQLRARGAGEQVRAKYMHTHTHIAHVHVQRSPRAGTCQVAGRSACVVLVPSSRAERLRRVAGAERGGEIRPACCLLLAACSLQERRGGGEPTGLLLVTCRLLLAAYSLQARQQGEDPDDILKKERMEQMNKVSSQQ